MKSPGNKLKWPVQFSFQKKIFFFSTCLSLFSLSNCFSQTTEEKKDWFENGEFFYNSEDYQESVFYYLKLHDAEPENGNINYHIGSCYLNIAGQERKSIAYFEQALPQVEEKYTSANFKSTIEQDKAPLHTYFFLAQAYRIDDQMDKALEMLDKFSNSVYFEGKYNDAMVSAEFEACKKAQIIMERPVIVSFTNLGPVINSSNENYNPVLSQDTSVIIYMKNLKFYNAIFMSRKVNGIWQEADNITPEIGSDGDTYPCSLSPDAKTLYLVRKTKKNSHIYISRFVYDKWSLMEPMNENINSKGNETHASLSANGKKLYFASDRKGSLGGLDIWCSELQADGQWGKAVNLGPNINTRLDEDNPFESANGNVLFFVSQGHLNMGGFDIFYSKKVKNQWSPATNLGYPVNTTTDDKFYFPVGKGTTAYMARRMSKGLGHEDIYRVSITGGDPMKDLYPDYKNEGYLTADKNVPVANVNLPNDTLKKIPVEKTGQPVVPAAKLPVQPPKDTAYRENPVSPTPLLSDEENVPDKENAPVSTKANEKKKILAKAETKVLTVAEKQIFIRHLHTVFFAFNSYKLSPDTKVQLDVLVDALQNCHDLEIEIRGYTDVTGTAEANLNMSQNRVQSVVKYLVGKGIDSKKLHLFSFGKENPIALNTNPDGSNNPNGRKFNRRVEFSLPPLFRGMFYN